MDLAADLPIPKRPPWVRGVTDKAALVLAEQARPSWQGGIARLQSDKACQKKALGACLRNAA